MLPLFKTAYFTMQLRSSLRFYEETAGYEVAERFLDAVENALNRVAENPHCAPRYSPPEEFLLLKDKHYRVLNIQTSSSFPYNIYFEVESQRLIIQAIRHHARNPLDL